MLCTESLEHVACGRRCDIHVALMVVVVVKQLYGGVHVY